MKLWSLNRVFRMLGFRLVVEVDNEHKKQTTLYFVSNKEWKLRTNGNANKNYTN